LTQLSVSSIAGTGIAFVSPAEKMLRATIVVRLRDQSKDVTPLLFKREIRIGLSGSDASQVFHFPVVRILGSDKRFIVGMILRYVRATLKRIESPPSLIPQNTFRNQRGHSRFELIDL
jgi:hypothetical protein